MNVSKILAALRQEREQIEEAIQSLERLARGKGGRRGRLPRWFHKPSNDPDEGSGGTPGEGCVGVPYAFLTRRPRRPPPSNCRRGNKLHSTFRG